ncbi:hypothetical protein [Candidatus Harpocratesius sp.]
MIDEYISQKRIICPNCNAHPGLTTEGDANFPDIEILKCDVKSNEITTVFLCRMCGCIVKLEDKFESLD